MFIARGAALPVMPSGVALHTDHCLKDKLEKFVLPLVEETERRRAAGQPNLFTGHMFDGSNLPLKENLDIAAGLLERFAKNDLVLEIETGAVGGEEDDVVGDHAAKLYTTPEDTLAVAKLFEFDRRPLPARGDVRQRARSLQTRPREAASESLEGMPGRGGEGVRRKRALSSRLSRRLRFDAGRNP